MRLYFQLLNKSTWKWIPAEEVTSNNQPRGSKEIVLQDEQEDTFKEIIIFRTGFETTYRVSLFLR